MGLVKLFIEDFKAAPRQYLAFFVLPLVLAALGWLGVFYFGLK